MARAAGVCARPGCFNLRPCPDHTPTAWAGSTRRARLPTTWDATRRKVLTRDSHRCQTCGAHANQVDHIVAGDDHSLANLQALCEPCHQRKTIAER